MSALKAPESVFDKLLYKCACAQLWCAALCAVCCLPAFSVSVPWTHHITT